MTTVYRYCLVLVQRLLAVIHTIMVAGSFMSGPRTHACPDRGHARTNDSRVRLRERLGPERLGWLTTPAANIGHRVIWGLWKIGHVAQIAASFSVCGWNTLAKCLSSLVIPAKAGISVVLRQNADARFRGHDGPDWGMGWTGFVLIHTSRALAPLFSTIVIRAGAWRGLIPSICLKAGPALR